MKNKKQMIFRWFALFLIPLTVFGLTALGFLAFRERKADPVAVTFTVLSEDVPAEAASHLHEGDRIVDRKKQAVLGTVRAIRTENEGEFCDLVIEIAGEGADGFTAGETPLYIGEELAFRAWDYAGSGKVVAIG